MIKIPKVIPLTLLYILLFLAFFISCTSCTPTNRLNRLQKRHPSLFNKKNDTIKLVDTIKVMIPGTTADTNLSVKSLMRDTVTIYKNGVTTKIFIHKDTLYLQNTTDTIYRTIIRKIEVPYERFSTENLPRDKLRWNEILILILGLIATVNFIQNTTNKRKQERST